MSTPQSLYDQINSPDPETARVIEVPRRPNAHDKVNKALTTLTLLLGIVALAVFLILAFKVNATVDRYQDVVSEVENAEEVPAPEVTGEVPDTGQDLGEFGVTELGAPTSDGTVCVEDAKRNVVTCEGPSANDGELYYNGVVID
jgi:hypothetical protein